MSSEEIIRKERLKRLQNEQVEAYPASAKRTHTAKQAQEQFSKLDASKEEFAIAGRIIAVRKHGGLTFVRVKDVSGIFQIVLHRDVLTAEKYDFFHETVDIGDFYSFTGTAFTTKKGEASLDAIETTLLSKSLLPLPEKWHGLTDTETRFRKRYLDLIANDSVMESFKLRSRVVHALRSFYHKENFMEVETPILQPLAGGADAKPFITHHNALDSDLYLRIAPELYLKRLLVGGFEKVFEIARCFRNEGISFQHNPEFTQVECYWAYADLDQMITHLEELLQHVLTEAVGSMKIEHEGEVLDFTAPIKRLSFYDLVLGKTGINLEEIKTEQELESEMKKRKLDTNGAIGLGELADELWKRHVRPSIIQPTFVTHYPAAMKPLAKRDKASPDKSSNVQLLVKGMEVLNGFDELNDPLEQEERFEEQEALRDRGREDAQSIDRDYLEALKIGMPPAAGYGIGIDRLCLLLTGSHNIKEVILFPTLKQKPSEHEQDG